MRRRKILFVIDRIGFNDISSIPILSSIAKKDGHQVDLVEFDLNPKKAFKVMAEYKPDIVCFSVCSNEAAGYLEINRLFKQKFSFFSLFGGPHPTFFPEYIHEKGVDAICRGEADLCFPLFLDTFGEEQMYHVPNLSLKTNSGKIVANPLMGLVENLDKLPFPDRGLIYSKSSFLSKSPIKTFFAGRGCPYSCSYCFNHAFNEAYKGKGAILRSKSVDFLLREIKEVARVYPLSFLRFHDDIFGFDRKWLCEFSERYSEEIGLPFFIFARPNMVDEGYADLLRRAGCYSVSIGVECGNEKMRFEVLNRRITNNEIENARKILRKFNLRVCTLNIIGLPGESEKEIFETIDFNTRLKPDFADATIFQPFPGTQIHKFCKERGYLSDQNTGSSRNLFETSILNIDEGFRQRIYLFHRLFSMLVDWPFLRKEISIFFNFKTKRIFYPLLNFFYKIYYGFNLHRKIYDSKISFLLRIRACFLLFSSQKRC